MMVKGKTSSWEGSGRGHKVARDQELTQMAPHFTFSCTATGDSNDAHLPRPLGPSAHLRPFLFLAQPSAACLGP